MPGHHAVPPHDVLASKERRRNEAVKTTTYVPKCQWEVEHCARIGSWHPSFSAFSVLLRAYLPQALCKIDGLLSRNSGQLLHSGHSSNFEAWSFSEGLREDTAVAQGSHVTRQKPRLLVSDQLAKSSSDIQPCTTLQRADYAASRSYLSMGRVCVFIGSGWYEDREERVSGGWVGVFPIGGRVCGLRSSLGHCRLLKLWLP